MRRKWSEASSSAPRALGSGLTTQTEPPPRRKVWATDPARLAVDLLLRSVDAGAQSMFFSGFPVWRRLAAQLGRMETQGPAVNQDTGTMAALAALNWLTDNLRAYCHVIAADDAYRNHGWEWHASLAVFFLRSAYNNSIPAPKRALALVAACDQIKCATLSLPHLP